MTDPQILTRVQRVLVNEFELDPGQLACEAKLYEELGLDSLDSVDLVVALEKEFDFKVVRSVDEEKIRAIRTIQDVCDFIDYKRQNLPPA
ncbi:acyl carrier protein [bacterium]|nr:acyl carrier protein [bacterium]